MIFVKIECAIGCPLFFHLRFPLAHRRYMYDMVIPVADEPKHVINDKVKDAFTPVAFRNQKLEGYLGERFDKNLEERLLKIDEDGIMAGYLHRPGSHLWIGEHIGMAATSVLDPMVMLYKYTGEKKAESSNV